MIPDLDIYRSANLLVKQHGDAVTSARRMPRRRRLEARLFFCRRPRSHTPKDPGLENVIRQALADAQAAGRDHLNQIEVTVRAVQRARPDMIASDALAAVNLVRRQ